MVITGSHMEFPYGFLLWGFTKGFYNGFFLLWVFNNHAINKIITMRLIYRLKYVLKSIKLKMIINFWYIYKNFRTFLTLRERDFFISLIFLTNNQ